MSKNTEFESANYMGKISWSRISCGTPRNFFGSEIKSDHPICLRICDAEVQRDLSVNHYHSKVHPIVEIEMTPIQWAEFLTGGNTDGVPCTVISRSGERMDEVPQSKIIDHFENETQETFEEFQKGADNIIAQVKAALDSGKPMGKKQMEELLSSLNTYKHNTVSNLNYVKDTFKETMSEVVVKAKAEVNAFVETKALQLGMEDLKNNIQLAIENKETNQ